MTDGQNVRPVVYSGKRKKSREDEREGQGKRDGESWMDREGENAEKIDEREIDVNLISVVERGGQFAQLWKSAYAPRRDTYIHCISANLERLLR